MFISEPNFRFLAYVSLVVAIKRKAKEYFDVAAISSFYISQKIITLTNIASFSKLYCST
jgi:hypothetical protein